MPSCSMKQRFLMWAALFVVVFAACGPVLVAMLSSFKLERDIFTFVPKLIVGPTLENYQALVRDWPQFFVTLRRSMFVTICSAFVILVVSLPAAYSYSRLQVRGVSTTSLFLIGVRMIPPIIITIPLYPLFRGLGITDTPVALILVYSAFEVSLSVMLLKTFIDGIPPEIEEQASIDGCSRFQAFIRVLLPLLAPGIIAVILMVSMFTWNDFVFAFLLTGTSAKTAPVMIAEMRGLIGQGAITWGTIFAAATVQMLPILTLIWIAQKRLVGGIVMGAVKG